LVGSIQQSSATFLTKNGGMQTLADHFLTRFTDAYVAEVQDFVDNVLNDRPPRVTGEDGLRALEIAVAAETSYREAKPCGVNQAAR